MKWEDFKDHVAIAHLIPYLREFVSNMTARLPLSVLMIPPINTSKMLEEFRDSKIQVKSPPED
jgi:preprotein translocase subunit SecB